MTRIVKGLFCSLGSKYWSLKPNQSPLLSVRLKPTTEGQQYLLIVLWTWYDQYTVKLYIINIFLLVTHYPETCCDRTCEYQNQISFHFYCLGILRFSDASIITLLWLNDLMESHYAQYCAPPLKMLWLVVRNITHPYSCIYFCFIFWLLNPSVWTPWKYLELPSLSFVKLANHNSFCKSKMSIVGNDTSKYWHPRYFVLIEQWDRWYPIWLAVFINWLLRLALLWVNFMQPKSNWSEVNLWLREG